MAWGWRGNTDDSVLGLIEEAGRNVERSTLILRDLLVAWPERPDLVAELKVVEHEGDRITHDIIHRLNNGRRQPLRAEDGHALATTLDDIVDYAEQTADSLDMYRVEAPMEQAHLTADVLVGAAEQVSRGLQCLAPRADMAPNLVEIHRLENEGDRIAREAVASLFANGIDPMVVIRWKDIFESLEASVDACEAVAHVLEGIAIKRR
jgi:uncharacterized protein Yka (UPF0111/DUF47 family)